MVWPGNEAGPVLLWEPGGPGLALPALPPPHVRSAAGGRAVALLPEHWERGRVRDQRTYRADVLELLDEQEVGAVYAESFGAARVGSVLPELARERVRLVLDSPAPPSGTSATRLLTARAAVVDRLAEADVPCHPACTSQVPGLAAALHAASYAPTGPAALAPLLTAWPGPLPDPAAATVDRLARGFLLETGDDLAARRAGYFGELCPAYEDWPAADGPSELFGVLASLHGPCRQTSGQGRWASPTRTPSLRGCLVVGTDDPAAPAELGLAWQQVLPGLTTEVVAGRGHRPLVPEAACDVLD